MNSKTRDTFILIKKTFDERFEKQESKNKELNENFIKIKCLMEEYNETLVFFRDTLMNFNKEIEIIKKKCNLEDIDENDSEINLNDSDSKDIENK